MSRVHSELTCVINVRNGEKFIGRTLESVSKQTMVPKVLVIDNFSTDATAQIVSQFANATLVRPPQAMKLGEARNFSLTQVNSEFVTWLDADDLWMPTFVEESLKIFRDTPNAAFLSTCAVKIDEEDKVIMSLKTQSWLPLKNFADRLTPSDSAFELIRKSIMPGPWCSFVFRTEKVKEVGGFDSTLSYAEDLDLIVRLSVKNQGYHLHKILSKYRIHANQETNRLRFERFSELETVASKIKSDINADEMSFLKALISLREQMHISIHGKEFLNLMNIVIKNSVKNPKALYEVLGSKIKRTLTRNASDPRLLTTLE
jgi:glycosyltransferase involved in cell wall biosynthesis